MADEPEDDLAVARRQVLEGEERVARQLVLIKKLDLAGRHEDARAARELLGTLTETLNADRLHLQIEMEAAPRRR